MSTERELILLCRTKIEQVLNWGDSGLWTNSDFELLSDKIFEKTSVRLSISTLKRIWGKVKYDNSPTAATLNALANFLDYASWRDFEAENNKSAASVEIAPEVPVEQPKNNRRRVAIPIAMFVVIVVVFFLLVKGKSSHRFDPSRSDFSHREVTDDLPNSVVFDYDVSSYKNADSAFIQQDWDPMRREKVSLKGKQHTSVYYEPGYFTAKLIVNDTVMREDVVWIKTKGWKGILLTDKTPIYVSDEDLKLGDKIGFTREILKEKWETSVFTGHGATLQNVKDFNVDVKDFQFETLVRNTSTIEECVCRRVVVYLLTSEMAIIVPLTTKGCSSEISVLTTNGWKSGKENDFSAFGCEFKNLEKLNVGLKDSVLNISLNDNVIFTEKQMHPNGKIVGLRVAFEGAGEMQYAKLNGEMIQ